MEPDVVVLDEPTTGQDYLGIKAIRTAIKKLKEQVKHLPIKFGEVARYVIVPGDPNRVPVIAESLENVINQGQNREFNAYKGTYKGIDVSVVSTGIGCPSTAIAVEE